MQHTRVNKTLRWVRNLSFLLGWAMSTSVVGQSAVSLGDQSPIIRGVNTSITYFNQEKTSVQIPESILPLLAGVMIMNKNNPLSANFQPAIQVWLDKYIFLEKKIASLSSSKGKQLAAKFLAEGNFPEVEKIVRAQTSYTDLEKYFPASYQTSGRQSPILIGDNSTVSYVVTKVIEYKLPESLTRNLVDRIYAQDQKINSLNLRISDRDEVIENWIALYHKLEYQIGSSPDSINMKAWMYFSQGNLDAALAEIDRAQPAGTSLGRISFLKAQIRLLQFDYLNYENCFQEINKQFQIASILDEQSADVLFGYAQFIVEFSADNVKKIEILENADRKIPTDSAVMKFTIALQLSDSYTNLQRHLTAEQYLKKARQYTMAQPDEYKRVESLFLFHIAMGRLYGPTNQPHLSVAHCDSAILIAQQYPALKKKNIRYWYVAQLNRLLPDLFNPATQKDGLKAYMEQMNLAENDLKEGVVNQMVLLDRYGFLANQYASIGDWTTTKRLLLDISERLRAYITPSGQIYFQMYFKNWLYLIYVFAQNGNFVEWESQLHQMDGLLTELSAAMPPGALQINQSRLEYEYALYLMAYKKPAEALIKLQAYLDFLIQHLPQDPEGFSEYTAKCIDNIGECYGVLYRTSEGISYLSSLVSSIERIQNMDDKNYTFAKIKIYRRIGALYQLEGKQDSARAFLQKGLKESEIRLSAANDAFLYDFINLSYDLSSSYLTFDNARAIEVMEIGRSKVMHYIAINPGLRQRYLPDLAFTTGYTAHIYALSRDYSKANQMNEEAHRLYLEIQQPNNTVRYMAATFLTEFCDFLESVDYLFPKLSKKERADIARRKCLLTAETIEVWKNLPDDPIKLGNLSRLNGYLLSCQ